MRVHRANGAYIATAAVLLLCMVISTSLVTTQYISANSLSSAPTSVPGVPTSFTTISGDSKVTLNWTAPNATAYGTITGYNVYRGIAPGASTLLAIPTTTTYLDTGLTNGQKYYYSISAVNDLGEGPRTNEVNVTPASAPGTPIGLVVTASDGQASLSWSAPYADGGASITFYKIYRGTSSNMEIFLASVSGTTYRDTGLTNGQKYFYKVSAVNSVGEGTRSIEASVTYALSPGPVNLVQIAPSNGKVTLTWNPPGNTGGSAIKGYNIYRGTAPDREMFFSTVTGTTYTDDKLTNGQTYYYCLSAVNNVGEGPLSSEISATPVTMPNAPTKLVASPSDQQVSLNWSAPANNGGSAVQYYRVYRSTTTGGEVFLSNAFTTSYVDTELTNGNTYYYKVSAVNDVGEGAMSSEASAAAGKALSPTGVLNTTISLTPEGALVMFNVTSGSSNYVYRYDWEMDGTWDTDWVTNTTYSHDYSPGNYSAQVQVYDASTGLTTNLYAPIDVPGEETTPQASSGGGMDLTLIIVILCAFVGGLLLLRVVLKRRGR